MLTSFLLIFAIPGAFADKIPATELASRYGLVTSTSFPFPSATQPSSSAQSLIVSQWSLGKGRIQDGGENLAFVPDPFPNSPAPNSQSTANSSNPVLQVTYEAGSFSHNTGGSQWYNLWNTTDASTFQTMIASYEVAFDEAFPWVKGGKLPGLRGGLNSTGCSGGTQSDGKDCFSTRLMWRTDGAGEVYAYIPPANSLCKQKDVICNSDFGISIGRGDFSLVSSQWNRITLLVRMNNPSNVANGNVQLFYNDVLAINHTGLQIRSASTVNINGFYFSTFFGGSDESWATPTTTHTYFRNIQLWGGNAPSNLTGQAVSAAYRPIALGLGTYLVLLVACALGWSSL